MQIDKDLLHKLEKLSALHITQDKESEVLEQLNEIVQFVEKLNELDLKDMEVMVNASSGGTPFRSDEAVQKDIIESVLKHAPKAQDHFFIVPKIIE
ncbi:Asp-tRNA(Asn)/Glu-tRNA(Gln) amidotransferase GatCAB subunit C [Campylobacter sp. MIT 99-7217]|uniref:Asp-tRNA(Asn)/Glu-tRNA(Gln) amidotransferase subunit GatC n=1 Tax=Campylobacter sp. MIT 99-7217 TaxID=535091 RepID=UPI00115AA264|nr:Asp-tRNA(Asn)/Glu-tRNA(Gln) amidotransferase subunit GatC [Campylobacter sp. MIT 99-7217]TQR33095.1 Asp-tRNA(Asn)/Glu-tRNA(Gln) amidotransferase GatCAB subunit C [Campylobacter sp. MIT 99-7217]